MVVKFNSAGDYLLSFGSPGSGNGELKTPSGIVIDAAGNIYVADSGNNRIQKFDSNGVYLSQFGSFGTGKGQFNEPVGLALSRSGNLYVCDVGNNRMQRFDSQGKYLRQSPGPEPVKFLTPLGIAVSK